MIAVSNKKTTCAGFSIAEVMVAAFIVMLSVGGLSMSFIRAVKTNRFASSYYNATWLARNRIQEAWIRPFKDLAALNELPRQVTKDGGDPVFGSTDNIYTRETIVIPTLNNCWDVTVKVYYPVSRGVLTDVPVLMKTVISGQFRE